MRRLTIMDVIALAIYTVIFVSLVLAFHWGLL